MLDLDDQTFRAEFDAVVGFGNRFAGSPGEAQCRDYLVRRFRDIGLAHVRCEPVPYVAWQSASAECRVVRANGSDAVPCTPLQYTRGEAVAEVLTIGDGSPDCLRREQARGSFEGKIVLSDSAMPFMFTDELAAAGIAGLVTIAPNTDTEIGHFTARLYPPAPDGSRTQCFPFPGVTVSRQVGERLAGLAAAERLSLSVNSAGLERAEVGFNVLGEVVGARSPEERVVIGAHYDTQAEGPGAWDNATGVAALLELAARWSQEPGDRTAVFIGFAVEELGLWGSYRYVLDHRYELDAHVAMVNLDALGPEIPARRQIAADPILGGLAAGWAYECGWHADDVIDGSLRPTADYGPFLDFGVPACGLKEVSPQHPYYHTRRDIAEHVDLKRAAETAQASGHIARKLAHGASPRWQVTPSKRWSPLATAELR